jgi:hypothetical protein
MMLLSSWLSLFKSDRTSDTPRIFIVVGRCYSVCPQMAGQGKRRKLEDAELLLHTGGISMQGLAQIMKIVKKIRLTKETSFGDKVLSAANSVRSAVMFEHMQHFGTNVFNQSQNHVIHC